MSSIKEKLKIVNILAALSLEERDEIYTLVDNQVTFVAGALATAGRADAAPPTNTKEPIGIAAPTSTPAPAPAAQSAAPAKVKNKPGPKPGSKKKGIAGDTQPSAVSTASSDPVAQAMASLESVDLS